MGIEKGKGREAEPLMNRPSSSSIKRTHFRFDKQKNKWNHVILDLPLFLIRSIWPYLLTKKLITTTKISTLRQFYITHQPRVKKNNTRETTKWVVGGKGRKNLFALTRTADPQSTHTHLSTRLRWRPKKKTTFINRYQPDPSPNRLFHRIRNSTLHNIFRPSHVYLFVWYHFFR